MQEPNGEPRLSADGKFYWNGSAWVPASDKVRKNLSSSVTPPVISIPAGRSGGGSGEGRRYAAYISAAVLVAFVGAVIAVGVANRSEELSAAQETATPAPSSSVAFLPKAVGSPITNDLPGPDVEKRDFGPNTDPQPVRSEADILKSVDTMSASSPLSAKQIETFKAARELNKEILPDGAVILNESLVNDPRSVYGVWQHVTVASINGKDLSLYKGSLERYRADHASDGISTPMQCFDAAMLAAEQVTNSGAPPATDKVYKFAAGAVYADPSSVGVPIEYRTLSKGDTCFTTMSYKDQPTVGSTVLFTTLPVQYALYGDTSSELGGHYTPTGIDDGVVVITTMLGES